jgi:hypothetical protein
MKSKLLLLSCFMLLSLASTFAQSTESIAVQGIARDVNNTVRSNTEISLKFTLYIGADNIVIDATGIKTDNFGVFSTSLVIKSEDFEKFANTTSALKLKIEQNIAGTFSLISDEVLSYVPYAIQAANGVPTGSIMPFIGTIAPRGWALCNGNPLPPTAKALIAMVGANAPNLNGMFLRGTGTSPVNQQAGPALKATQDDALESHLHDKGTLANSTDGNHSHTTLVYTHWRSFQGENGLPQPYGNSGTANNLASNTAGNHTHTISGNTGNTGALETRPVNYGVNYIIKL